MESARMTVPARSKESPQSNIQRTENLIPDLMGLDFSAKADCSDCSIVCQELTLDRWMDQLGIIHATIIGHAIGGGVVVRMARLLPNRVERLIVMNPVCYDSRPIELILQFGHPDPHHQLSGSLAVKLLRQA